MGCPNCNCYYCAQNVERRALRRWNPEIPEQHHPDCACDECFADVYEADWKAFRSSMGCPSDLKLTAINLDKDVAAHITRCHDCRKTGDAMRKLLGRPPFDLGDARRRLRRWNPDEEIRRQQRAAFSGDVEAEARHLKKRIRAGRLDPYRVELAAYLGHQASLLLVPDPNSRIEKQIIEQYNFRPEAISKFRNPDFMNRTSDVSQVLHFGHLELEFLAIVTADFSEHVLFVWERDYPDDDRPALAIQEVRKWIEEFPETYDAAFGYQILSGSREAASDAAEAAGDDNRATAQVAEAAANALSGTLTAKAFILAPGVAVLAVVASDDQEAELTWQRQHLIEMLLA